MEPVISFGLRTYHRQPSRRHWSLYDGASLHPADSEVHANPMHGLVCPNAAELGCEAAPIFPASPTAREYTATMSEIPQDDVPVAPVPKLDYARPDPGRMVHIASYGTADE